MTSSKTLEDFVCRVYVIPALQVRELEAREQQVDNTHNALSQNQPASHDNDGRLFPPSVGLPVPVQQAADRPGQCEGGHVVHAYLNVNQRFHI